MTEHTMSAHLGISEPDAQAFVAIGVTEPGHIEIVAKGFEESDTGALGVAEMLEDAARAIKEQIETPPPLPGETLGDYAKRMVELGLGDRKVAEPKSGVLQQEQKPRPRFNPQPRGSK